MKANRMNAAVLYAVLDPACHTLSVSNAGMIAPVLVGTRGVRYIDVGGLPLGAFPGAIYAEEAVELDPGDTLLFITDGVVEAHNEYGELFGFERLETLLGSLRSDVSVRELVTVVLDEVHSFMGDVEQHDDITLVAIQPTSSSQHVGSLQELELEVRAS
jgi:serine phosphatase RsbU (regulator of sigma subunit)